VPILARSVSINYSIYLVVVASNLFVARREELLLRPPSEEETQACGVAGLFQGTMHSNLCSFPKGYGISPVVNDIHTGRAVSLGGGRLHADRETIPVYPAIPLARFIYINKHFLRPSTQLPSSSSGHPSSFFFHGLLRARGAPGNLLCRWECFDFNTYI